MLTGRPLRFGPDLRFGPRYRVAGLLRVRTNPFEERLQIKTTGHTAAVTLPFPVAHVTDHCRGNSNLGEAGGELARVINGLGIRASRSTLSPYQYLEQDAYQHFLVGFFPCRGRCLKLPLRRQRLVKSFRPNGGGSLRIGVSVGSSSSEWSACGQAPQPAAPVAAMEAAAAAMVEGQGEAPGLQLHHTRSRAAEASSTVGIRRSVICRTNAWTHTCK